MHGGQRLGFVDYNFYFPLSARFCLCSARAAANWAEIAEQLGKIVELQKYSQQNVVPDHHGHPVALVHCCTATRKLYAIISITAIPTKAWRLTDSILRRCGTELPNS